MRMEYRTLRQPRKRGWWLRNPRYFLFMMREIGGVLAGFYALLFLWQLSQIPPGSNAYESSLRILYSAPLVLFSIVVLVFVLIHTFTWFSLVTHVLPPSVERLHLPKEAIVGGLVVFWLLLSWIVAVVVFGF